LLLVYGTTVSRRIVTGLWCDSKVDRLRVLLYSNLHAYDRHTSFVPRTNGFESWRQWRCFAFFIRLTLLCSCSQYSDGMYMYPTRIVVRKGKGYDGLSTYVYSQIVFSFVHHFFYFKRNFGKLPAYHKASLSHSLENGGHQVDPEGKSSWYSTGIQ